VPVRVMLVDDDELMRKGLSAVLSSDDRVEVVEEASDGRQAIQRARHARPDVVLMDVRMPELDGIAATRELLAERPDARVLILTTFETDDYIVGALRAGASGFLLKDVEPDELRSAVRVVAQGEALLSPSVTRRLIREFVAQPGRHRTPPELLEQLTKREREVMALVAQGLSNQEIAERLVISPATAKTHVSRAMIKLHAHDRAQLVVLAYETGLVRPPQ